jgi:hypothetical protein
MKRLFCLVSGHQRTLMAFTSNRFSCRRCGADLGRDIPAMPSRPAASLTRVVRLPSDPASGFPQNRSRHVRLANRGTERLQAPQRRGGA